MCQCFPPSPRVAPWSFGYFEPPAMGVASTIEEQEAYMERWREWNRGYESAMRERSDFIRAENERCDPRNQPVCEGCRGR